MRFIDMCGGIGGFRLGINSANKNWKCVGYYDNDENAVKSYNAIFEESNEPTDITKLKPEFVPEHDVICAEFPCQSFSISGRQLGFADTRGTIFFEIMRIAVAKKTPYLFLENVKNLLSHDKGETFRTILRTLDECGYDVQWQVINSRYFRIPQHRERLFIIANSRGKPRPKIFPIKQSSPTNEIKVVGNVYPSGGQNGMVYDVSGIAPTLRSGQGVVGNGIGSSNAPKIIMNGKLRRLTPKECWRLQGFPDWAFNRASEVVSDTQLFRLSGNTVTVPVIEQIVKCWSSFE